MKKHINITLIILLLAFTWAACKKDYPVDEDGLLISTRAECYVSSFEILGTDFVTARNIGKTVLIDTVAQTIQVEVKFGTDLKNLYPQFTLVTDAKLDPKIVGKVDFSDLANPKVYTVKPMSRFVARRYPWIISQMNHLDGDPDIVLLMKKGK